MDIKNLYREVILDHYANQRNKLTAQNVDGYIKKRGYNPSCGDDIVIFINYEDNQIKDIKHHCQGCSICCASTSVCTTYVKNKNIDEALKIVEEFLLLIKGNQYNKNILKGEALAFEGVKDYPARVKCASLSWVTVKEIIEDIKKEL